MRTFPPFWLVWVVSFFAWPVLSSLSDPVLKVVLLVGFAAILAHLVWFFTGEADVPQKPEPERLSYKQSLLLQAVLFVVFGLVGLASLVFPPAMYVLLPSTAAAMVEITRRTLGFYTKREWRARR